MPAIPAALVPVALVIAAGWALRRWRFPGESFWAPAERLTYFLLFPALLVHSLATASLGDLRVVPLAATVVSTVLIMVLVVFALRRRVAGHGPAFTSVLQGTIRNNAYVGIALAYALFGSAGLTLSALIIVFLVPTVNVACVATLSRYGDRAGTGAAGVLGALARNPLILACLLGIVLNATGIGLPPGISDAVEVLGRASLPLALLAVGAGLDLGAARTAGRLIGVTAVLKLVVQPALAALVCLVFGVGGLTAKVVILFFALPTASSSFVLARLLGGDTRLMAGIIAATTVLAGLTIPVALALLA